MTEEKPVKKSNGKKDMRRMVVKTAGITAELPLKKNVNGEYAAGKDIRGLVALLNEHVEIMVEVTPVKGKTLKFIARHADLKD